MTYHYDDQNIFARILRGEIPNDTVFETDHTLAVQRYPAAGAGACPRNSQGAIREPRAFRSRGVGGGTDRFHARHGADLCDAGAQPHRGQCRVSNDLERWHTRYARGAALPSAHSGRPYAGPYAGQDRSLAATRGQDHTVVCPASTRQISLSIDIAQRVDQGYATPFETQHTNLPAHETSTI